ncbi:hypothetical protein EHI8A_049790 [Entamoeba histolytica HM-1:IMSS-B]|uniref:Serine aminopeptidase S33 domain-containing protein n=6 Tax=Entamoeba histolytica TaxID=5759 RepID=C4M6U5_ENTH1|nr:hypothetical protein EHI_054120 [Entamoeba histolytica HM-1:IMSS]EMD48856.1 serine protease family S09X protein, putative [Entamoeba histolytica KU27]EMH73536.1 hypothetical protein EHI8A_049790 [Entamoeba histolytica HM-1:IMSS-B]EMS16332.1 serine protease family s09x protein, putative [Entamoeba histolytica HM-3:IMSS]ENY60718.1 serine protease family s09x protein, putative [Entamoeba histolytica HM-1:IMSS-A]GAT97213.1 hypothetical protein CL6EHI_054120 [Entamoeba histolytica]|eukprot:XP_651415.1 hypothetical protein EHI_054120 [Entamoeba histolytica HM-1:IMSS]
MEQVSPSISLRNGAKQWKKRHPSNCESLPQFIKISGNIPGLLIRPADGKSKCTILYSHDSTERLETIHQWLVNMSMMLHSNIIAYEFPGYMDDSSEYSDTLVADIITKVFNYILEEMKQPSKSIVLYGKGAGCGPTLFQAFETRKENEVGGVILINPVVNASILTRSPFHKASHIKAVTSPVAIIFGQLLTEKKYIRKLYSLIQNKGGLGVIEGGGNDLEKTHSDELTDEIINFLIEFIPELQCYFNGDELEKQRPVEYQTNSIDEISQFLKQRNLQHLTELFISYGYCKVEHFMSMCPDEIDFLGLEENDKTTFKQLIEDAKNDPLLLYPKQSTKTKPTSIASASRIICTDEAWKDLDYKSKRKSMKDVVMEAIGLSKRSHPRNSSICYGESVRGSDIFIHQSNISSGSTDSSIGPTTPNEQTSKKKGRLSFIFKQNGTKSQNEHVALSEGSVSPAILNDNIVLKEKEQKRRDDY